MSLALNVFHLVKIWFRFPLLKVYMKSCTAGYNYIYIYKYVYILMFVQAAKANGGYGCLVGSLDFSVSIETAWVFRRTHK